MVAGQVEDPASNSNGLEKIPNEYGVALKSKVTLLPSAAIEHINRCGKHEVGKEEYLF
jgi:hypothetical protein